jgi:hypothetical protein
MHPATAALAGFFAEGPEAVDDGGWGGWPHRSVSECQGLADSDLKL